MVLLIGEDLEKEIPQVLRLHGKKQIAVKPHIIHFRQEEFLQQGTGISRDFHGFGRYIGFGIIENRKTHFP